MRLDFSRHGRCLRRTGKYLARDGDRFLLRGAEACVQGCAGQCRGAGPDRGLEIPPTSLLSATAPKPVGGYTETILRIIDIVFVALSQAAPEMVNGCAYGTINALSMAGHRADGRRWVMFSFFGGGHGGHPQGDGLNTCNIP